MQLHSDCRNAWLSASFSKLLLNDVLHVLHSCKQPLSATEEKRPDLHRRPSWAERACQRRALAKLSTVR
jgi:hypothetical protein